MSQPPKPSRRGSRRPRRGRGLALSLALVLAAATVYALVRGGGGGSAVSSPPLDQIDDASRARLERVLREAENGEQRER